MTEATRSYPEGATAALEQIAAVCADNMDANCNHRMALDFVRQIANDCLSRPPAQQAVDCGEMVRVAKMAKAAAEMELGLAASPDFSPRDMLDAANAALATVPSTDRVNLPSHDETMANLDALTISSTPRCTCAAIVNPNIPHARSCPLSSAKSGGAS